MVAAMARKPRFERTLVEGSGQSGTLAGAVLAADFIAKWRAAD
jgi:hypothetical protein